MTTFWPPMHELSICQALIEQVTAIAHDQSASSVCDIYVSIGPLSGVESHLLQNAFPIAAAGTVAGGATLHLHSSPVRIVCEQCGEESEVAPNRLVCGQCVSWRTRMLSGDELLLERVCLQQDSLRRMN